MHETVLVRQALLSDLRATAVLYKDLDETHEVLDVGLRVRGTKGRRDHLRLSLDAPHSRVAVACSDDRVVGFVIARFAQSRPDVIVEALSVARAFRRRGLATALMRHVEAWAKDRGARFVELDVYEFNPEARAFYEFLGYLTTRRTMRKDPNLDVLALTSQRSRPGR